MSYQNAAKLSIDQLFVERNRACVTEQALIFKDDGRADISALGEQALQGTAVADGMMPLICAQPGFGDVTEQSAITDGQLLSAVQAVWPTYAALLFPQD